jgi:predicted nuclease of predicted toxin-antitoxin system
VKFLIDNNLSPLLAEDLAAGAIVVLHEDSLRVRRLPMPD